MTSPSASGRTFGHLRILDLVGSGGMGEVYRARDLQLERDVAVKILPSAGVADPSARARLLREARTASQLNHPNICTIHEVGEADGEVFIAMELVTGEPLSAILRRGPLATDVLLRYALQLADAVRHAQQQNVVHRDLKSANVMVTAEGRVKVLDFGLAKQVEVASPNAATRSVAAVTEPWAIVGTLAYMAPEQLRGQPADARSDVWALGVMLYEMATGALPFGGATDFETASAILQQPVPALPAGVPAGLRAAIHRCLEKDPSSRCQNAGELRAALEAALPSATGRRAFDWRWGTLVVAALLAAVVALKWDAIQGRLEGRARIRSVAVLPLANLSGDPQQEYFADAMTEAIITDLGRLTGMKRVSGRASVMQYKGTRKTPAEIARELRVDALVTGAVVRSDGRLALTAQLIDPVTGAQIWSHRYERDLTDVLRLQSELTIQIAGEIRLKLEAGEERRLASAAAVDPEVYDAYLKGRFHWQKRSPQGLDTAEKYFELALSKDPASALAHSGLSTVWGLRCMLRIMPCSLATARFKEEASRALQLDPGLPEARAIAAAVTFYVDWDWDRAGLELRQVVERDPAFPEGHIWYAEYLSNVAGRPGDGVAEVQRALDSDPANSYYQAWLGEAMLRARRYDDAIAHFRRLLESDPDLQVVRTDLQKAFEAKGMPAEAMAVMRESVARANDPEAAEALERGYEQGGYRQAMRLRADLAVKRSRIRYVAPSSIARFYAAAGDVEPALDWLEKAYQEHDTQMVRLSAWPEWDPLRSHPRFQALLRKLKLSA